jgi:tRNA(Glu) U13 pseudouridine synthase TruD
VIDAWCPVPGAWRPVSMQVASRNPSLTEEAIRGAAGQLPRMAVEDFRPSWRLLHIGHHGGNRFRIVVRDVQAAAADVHAAAVKVCSRGFINYYGLQRFSHTGTRNVAVGRACACVRVCVCAEPARPPASLEPLKDSACA